MFSLFKLLFQRINKGNLRFPLEPSLIGNLWLRRSIRCVASSDAPEGADRWTLRVRSPLTPPLKWKV
jgi:hypothetical protein